MKRYSWLILSGFFLTSCASYQYKVESARADLRSGHAAEAAQKIAPLANEEGKDQLVYLFDYATILQHTGDYKASTKYYLMADKIAEVKDYHSVSKISASMLLDAGQIQYKGEDYEKVLINCMLAYNFLMQGDLDEALVEARRVNEKLYKYKFEAKKNYEQNSFALYLSAMIWESARNWDDAYIAYKHVYDIDPDNPFIREDLVRAAIRAQRPEEFEKWRKTFKIEPKAQWKDKSLGEIVLVYQQGWGPRKYPSPNWHRVPKLYPVISLTQSAKLIVEGIKDVRTERIYSVQDVAIKTLDDAYGDLIAARMAGIATKAVVADQIRQNDEGLGQLAWIIMNVADQADLRQWSTLPETFQVARVPLAAGKYRVRIQGLDAGGAPTGEAREAFEVEVKPGRKTFIGWRSFS